MIELKDSTIEKLKCSQCKAYLSCAPVMLKLDGKNICGRCKILTEDQIQHPSAIRNKAYEEIAAIVTFPCRYRQEGCTKTLQWNNVINHEEKCDYRTYNCPCLPLGSCRWIGTNSQLLDHYKESHPNLLLDHPCYLSPDLSRDCDENYLMTVFGFLFLVQVKLNTSVGKLWSCVRYLGNSAFISNFEFNLEVRNFHALMKKCKKVSPREGLVINRANCIEVNIKTLIDFFGENENISFVVWVKKKGSICFKCQKDLKPLKLYYLGESSHCENCRDDLVHFGWKPQKLYFREN